MKIIWTKRAYKAWLEAAQYIRTEFGQKALVKFQNNTKEWENVLISMPNVGAVEQLLKGLGKEYRSIVVSKHNKLIYSIETEKGHIKIDDFWDTRREPILQATRLK